MSSIDTSNVYTSDSGITTYSGLSSGVDFKATIDAIMDAKRLPIDKIESKITTNTSKISAYEELKSLSSSFADKLNYLRGNTSISENVDVFSSKVSYITAALADGAAEGATVTSPSTLMGASVESDALTGTHKVIINQLAKAHQLRGDSFDAKNTDVTSGTTPAVTEGTFTINGDTVTVAAGDSLVDIRDKINNLANANVNATVVSASDSSHYLVITAADTGTDNSITISNTATSQDLGLVNSGDGSIKNQLQAAQNANLDVNGITGISRSSNTIDDILEGVTLSLYSADVNTEMTIEIENDLSTIKSTIADFVDSYNALRDFVKDQRTETDRDGDGEADDIGPLAYDSTLRQVLSKLNELVSQEVQGLTDGYQSLSQIGIALNDDYELVIDEDTFDNKLLTDVDEMRKLFAFDFSSSDSRVVHLSHTSSTTYTVDGSNVVEPYYLDIDGTDVDGNITGANIDTAAGGTGYDFDISGSVITLDNASSGADGLKLFFNGGASAGSVTDIQISFTRGVADQFYSFFDDLSKNSGTIDEVIEQVENQNDSYQEDIQVIEARLEVVRASLEARFIAMETLLSELNSTKDTLTQFSDAAYSDN